MEAANSSPNGLLNQAKAIGTTGFSTLQNRAELFALELEEERSRLLELLVWVMVAGFLGVMCLGLATVFIIFMFPADMRIWALAGFCALYLVGAALAFLNLKSLLNNGPPPFAGSINEMKKDREWLESSK